MLLHHKPSRLTLVFVLVLSLKLFTMSTPVVAQEPQTAPQGPDLIEQLRLTPEQRQRIRAIREQSKNERMTVNQRLRESNLALEEALDSDNLDENLVEQRIRDVSAAQAAQLRMRIHNEVQIRRVLSADQIATWRLLRQRALLDNPRRRGRALAIPRAVAPRR
ncbi:MAG TPA: Spy/CpxP family protein refolding chaperone [Pyrinomonadaceae bacterium]|nr:Spy/CpxP family protein refolding chaperone [Pyrinomonadaceae bacterium]